MRSFGFSVFGKAFKRVISSVVERFVYTEDVGSSTLSSPTIRLRLLFPILVFK